MWKNIAYFKICCNGTHTITVPVDITCDDAVVIPPKKPGDMFQVCDWDSVVGTIQKTCKCGSKIQTINWDPCQGEPEPGCPCTRIVYCCDGSMQFAYYPQVMPPEQMQSELERLKQDCRCDRCE